MSRIDIRHCYETWGAHTCIKCALRVILYARLARRGALRRPIISPAQQPPRTAGRAMSRRPRHPTDSTQLLSHDNRVNDIETHSELLGLRFELAQSPLSHDNYCTANHHTTFGLPIQTAAKSRCRPLSTSAHQCVTVPPFLDTVYRTVHRRCPITSRTSPFIMAHTLCGQITSPNVISSRMRLGDIIYVCQQFHYDLPALSSLVASIHTHLYVLNTSTPTRICSTSAHLTSTRSLPPTPVVLPQPHQGPESRHRVPTDGSNALRGHGNSTNVEPMSPPMSSCSTILSSTHAHPTAFSSTTIT